MLFQTRPHSARGKRGFTLVELLVVIGIIAILMGLLMPSLSRARESGRASRCLSNLRSIGQAFNMYSAENRGFIVPGSIQWYDGGPQGGRGEENWATMLVSMKYLTATSQIETSNAGTPPAEIVMDNENSYGDTVFRCPTGSDRLGVVGPHPGTATHRKDPANDTFWRRQSMLFHGPGKIAQGEGAMIDTWYGANMYQPQGAGQMNSMTLQQGFPMRVMARNRASGTPGRMFGGPMSRQTQIKKSSEMALLFDGLRSHNFNTYNISPRHHGWRYANFLFADGHAEAVHIDSLPNGFDASNSDLASAAALEAAGKRWPKWRLDQP